MALPTRHRRFTPPGPRRKFQETDAPPGSESWPAPWVQLKYFSYHPTLYPAMIRAVSPGARAGDLVAVYDKDGRRFGAGLYHPEARVPLRMFHHGESDFGEDGFRALLERALDLRLNWFRLPETTDAFRVVHSDGDGLSGLVVDKYGDVLSVEVHSYGVQQRLADWLPALHKRLGTTRQLIQVDDRAARWEGIKAPIPSEAPPRAVKIREHGIRYEVNFEEGHKTGFFCDQRENRRRLSSLVKGRRVLDLCCYTGGFSLAAASGGAREVTGVDLDEKAIEQARRNANLNQARVDWVHCDAFSYARQMQRNHARWDVVVLDPPKFVQERDDVEGRKKYEDLNGLGISLLEPGGLLATCSCSGLVSPVEFESHVVRAAHRQKRNIQSLAMTGAGPDHPVMANCPESHYLKVIWARVV